MSTHARLSWRTMTVAAICAITAGLSLTACGSDDSDKTVTLVTHESFNVSKDVLKEFEKNSGLKVKVQRSGDAGTAVNQAILTKDKPQGDVFYGIDNTFLSRALDEGVFESYKASGLDAVSPEFQLDSKHRVTPVDYGDVCVNYDKKYYAARSLTPPQTLTDLTQSQYKDQLVVENPATSSPGLAFLLATIAEFGNDGWKGYWQQLKANGVEVVDGWEQAYNDRFSGGTQSKGDRPLVVSYATSPPAEVAFAEQPPAEAPTGVATDTCFRQIEFAGVLSGAKNPDGAQKFIDFMLGKRFQEDIPLQMFVFPVRKDAALPEVFTKHAVTISAPKQLSPADIAKNRDQWIKDWKSTVLGG